MTTTWVVGRVLRDRTARLCLTTVVVSGFGTSALWLASGVWVKDLTGSDGLAALCLLAMWTPALAGPALGALADRLPRKRLLIGCNLLLAALLPTLLWVDSPAGVWLVLAVLLVYGAVGVVHDAAESALVATAVAPELLGDVNGLRTTATEGMKLLAPLAGAGLYSVYGGPAVALLDAVTFVLATLLCTRLRVTEAAAPEPPRTRLRARTAEGFRALQAGPGLRPLVVAGGTTMFFAGLNGAQVYAVVDALGQPASYAGLLAAVQGAGSVVTGTASGAALRRLGERRFAAYGIGLTAVAMAARAVPQEAVALMSSAAIGAGLPCPLIAALTAVQRQVPGSLLGRAVATAHTLLFAPNVAGLALGAALVERVDHRVLLVALGVALLAGPALRLLRGVGPAAAEGGGLSGC